MPWEKLHQYLKKCHVVEFTFRLSLDNASIGRLFLLAFDGKVCDDVSWDELIEFDHFCQCFVAILSEITEAVPSDEGNDASCDENEGMLFCSTTYKFFLSIKQMF